jgi:hypothetical protein
MITANANANPHVASREGGDEPELMVWITMAAALVIGFFLMFFVTNQTTVASAGGTTLGYPSTWVPATEKGAAFAVADLKGGGAFGDRVSITQLAKTDLLPGQGTLQGQGGLPQAAANWSLGQQDARVGYRNLGVQSTTVSGKDAIQIESAYLMDSAFGTSGMPALMHAYDTIALSGDKFYVLSYATSNPDNDHAKSENSKLVSNWRVP